MKAAAQADPRPRRARSAMLVMDHIVITHPHADHYLGLDDLAALRRISRLSILFIYDLVLGL